MYSFVRGRPARTGWIQKKRGASLLPVPRIEAFASPGIVGTRQRRKPTQYMIISKSANRCNPAVGRTQASIIHIHERLPLLRFWQYLLKVAKFQCVRIEASSYAFLKCLLPAPLLRLWRAENLSFSMTAKLYKSFDSAKGNYYVLEHNRVILSVLTFQTRGFLRCENKITMPGTDFQKPLRPFWFTNKHQGQFLPLDRNS